MKQHVILAIAVLVGLAAAFLTHQYHASLKLDYRKMEKDLRGRYAQAEAVVFTRDMPRDTLIKLEDIGAKDVTAASLRSDAVSPMEASRLVGKRTVNPVNREKPVNWSDIEGGVENIRSGLASEIPRGMLAISINVSGAAAVSGQVRPNDHVNVIGTFVLDSPDRPNEKEQVTLTVLQKVTVIATGRETTRSLSRASAERSGSYSTVTLLVTPREAETLIACEQNRGRLTLALRNPDDLGYEDDLPTVDFKYIRQTLNALNKTRQDTINRRTPAPLLGR